MYVKQKKKDVLKRQCITLWSCICSIQSRLHLYVHDIRIKEIASHAGFVLSVNCLELHYLQQKVILKLMN